MGISTDLIIPQIKNGSPYSIGGDLIMPNFICSLCHDLFEEAVAFQECKHTFCRTCIKDIKVIDRKVPCPICRKPFDPATDLTQGWKWDGNDPVRDG